MQNISYAVSFRSAEDIVEVWEQVKCLTDEDDKNLNPGAKKGREDRVDQLVEGLKAKHGNICTPTQFRIRADMVIGGVHSSHDEPPSNTMSIRSGSETVKRKSYSAYVVVANSPLSYLPKQYLMDTAQ